MSRDVTVLVVDSQQAMTVSGTSRFTIAEDTTSVWLGTYTATASGGGQITWSVEGADAAEFSISTGGELSLSSFPDYETKNSYTVVITADHRTGTGGYAEISRRVTINILPD